MQRQIKRSGKISFKVKFLNKYHDIFIDWNDDKYKYKTQQVFEQLESITGVLCKNIVSVVRHVTQDDGHWQPADILDNHIIHGNRRNYDLAGSSFVDGELFHLTFDTLYDRYTFNRVGIYYRLIPISEVQEGECSQYVCKYMDTVTFFNKIRDLVNDDELNLKIANRTERYNHFNHVQEINMVFKELNVRQYLQTACDFHLKRDALNNTRHRVDIYLRTSG